MGEMGLIAGEFSFNVEETCTIRRDGSVWQGTSGEGKSSGSAAGTGESSEGEGEEGTGGETKGTRGKKETGEWMSASARVALLSALGFKMDLLIFVRRNSCDWPRSRKLQKKEKLPNRKKLLLNR